MILLSDNQRKYTPTLSQMFSGIPAIWVPGQDEDIAFHGAVGYDIAVEIKKIGTDFVRSLLNNHLASQLSHAKDRGYSVAMLATYGDLDYDPQTHLARARVFSKGGRSSLITIDPPTSYQTLMRRLYTILIKQNVIWVKGQNLKDMCDQLSEWFWWWQAPPEMHISNEQPYNAVYMSGDVPLTVRVAKELPHIGIKRATDVAARFKSVQEMVEAGEREWQQIYGIGRTTALEIMGKPGWKRDNPDLRI